jgi:hypothetical protein
VLFEGPAAAQIVKILIGDQLGGTPPPKTASAGSDAGGQQSVLAGKIGQRVAAPILSLVDDPLLAAAPGKAPVFGAYRVDDEGVPAQKVSLIEKGVLKTLLMTRTPRKEITRSNGHARAPRFAGIRAHVGTLVLTGGHGYKRAELTAELGKIAKGGGITTYIVRLLDDGSIGGDVDDLAALFSFGRGLGDRQRAFRLQLPGWRRRLLGDSLDDHRAVAAVPGCGRPPSAGKAPKTAGISVAFGFARAAIPVAAVAAIG